MTTEEYLISQGVTMQIARDFIMSNYELNLETVFNVCKQYGVNNDMIAEILATDIPGLTGNTVSGFFDTFGFNGNDLGFNSDEDIESTDNLDEYTTLDLGVGFSIFAESTQNDIEYTYTYDSSTRTLTQTDSDGEIEQRSYDLDGLLIESKDFDTQGNIEGISNYSYNSNNQITSNEMQLFNEGVQIGELLLVNTWLDDSVTTNIQSDVYGFGTFNINAVGEPLNSTKTAPIVWKVDEDSDGVFDSIDYYTYDNNGNEILDQEDTDADGIIDTTYTTEWLLIV